MHPILLTEISGPYLAILRQYFDRVSSIDLNRLNIPDRRLRRKLPKGWKDLSPSALDRSTRLGDGFDAEDVYQFYFAFHDLRIRVYGWFIIELWSLLEYLLKETNIKFHTCHHVPYFREANTVRLINNVLKHGDGKSFRELRQYYPKVLRTDPRRRIVLTKKQVKSFIHTTQSFLTALERHSVLTKK